MEFVAAIAGLASMLVSFGVGARLVLLSRRTGQAPEFLIGLGLVLVGGCWSALVAVGRQATALSDDTRVGLVFAGALCGAAGTSCLALFNWRVFRHASPWAPGLVAAVVLALFGIFAAQGVSPGWLAYAQDERGPWTFATAIAALNYTWSFLESQRQSSLLSRRLRLGLADPVVADRLRLWTWMMATSLGASLVFAICQKLGIEVGGTTLGLSLAAVVSLVTAALLCLAFVPPASYLESVRRRALVEG